MAKEIAALGHETRSARRGRRLSAFRPRWRMRLAALVSRAPAMEDLADSFPGLLFALASGYGSPARRRRASTCVNDGHPLKAAAAVLGLPMWLRRVPPQAFTVPLPPLPTDAEFALAMAGRLPLQAQDAALWFGRITHALKTCGRDFALWVAREPRLGPAAASDEDFLWLTAWAWFGDQPATRGHALLRRPWSPEMSWKKAREETAIWRKRIDLAATLGRGIRDTWFADGQALGMDIVALRTVEQFVAESSTMENCLDQYAPHLLYDRVRIFSVRKQGRSVASLELSLRADEATMAGISQLRGPRNRRVPTHVWQAVHAWLGSQPFRALASHPADPAGARDALRQIWQPYFDAVQATRTKTDPGSQVFVGSRLFPPGLRPASALTSKSESTIRALAEGPSTPRARRPSTKAGAERP